MHAWLHDVQRFASDDSGQDLIEYALLCALMGLAAVAALQSLANQISAAFIAIPQKVEAAMFS